MVNKAVTVIVLQKKQRFSRKMLGKIEEYNAENESIDNYLERLEQYFIANDIKDEKQIAVFLSVVGPRTYKLIKSLVNPEKPTDKTFAQLSTILKNQLNPKPKIIAERFRFHKRVQGAGETVSHFAAELKSLSNTCEFGQFLTEALRDRFVVGLRNELTQRKLLTYDKITYEKAFEMARADEMAEQDSKELQLGSGSDSAAACGGDVHKLSTEKRQANKPVRMQSEASNCYRCKKGRHSSDDCRFKGAKCHYCSKIGHIEVACLKKVADERSSGHRQYKTNTLQADETTSYSESRREVPEYGLFAMKDGRNAGDPPVFIQMTVDNVQLVMELDTGSAFTVLSEKTFKKYWPEQPRLEPVVSQLRTYTGEPVQILGEREVTVRYQEQAATLLMRVVPGSGPDLLGRNWLKHISLNWQEIFCLQDEQFSLDRVLQEYSEVFKDELGTFQGCTAKIHIDASVPPVFCRPRSLPYAMRDKVEQALDKLEKEGVISPVELSEWAAPIVPIIKADKSVRICGDYKLTVNKAAKVDKYPLPRTEDLFAQLAGAKVFTKLDLSQAYQQMLLDDDSKKLVVINTHRGLFAYNRLPYGVSSAPGIFQRRMEALLQGLPGVFCFLDDILLAGASEGENLKTLSEVLSRLKKGGLRLKRNKCAFLVESVTYLGHQIDATGLHPLPGKIEAITKAREPTNVSELKAFIGMITYYAKFLPNMSQVLSPLYMLLRKDSKWHWATNQQMAFQAAKQLLLATECLVHYDPELPVSLACDASSYGLGAVIQHIMPDGSERPVAFASRTMNHAEKNYSQLEKEALGILFGLKRFHSYLFGRQFTLYTDHKPLQSLFSENKYVPPMASSRIQRWALTLAMYNYTIQHKPSGSHCNADGLSRLPLLQAPSEVPLPEETVLLMEFLDDYLVTADQIREWTRRDPVLSKVVRFLLEGDFELELDELKPYSSRRHELSLQDGCILWGSRVVMPPQAREAVLQELHVAHPGTSRMKGLARMYVWWPGMDVDIENVVKKCSVCQESRPEAPKAPLHPWEWPKRPWHRLHVDYAGPVMGHMLLVIVDSHTKWIEVHAVNNATSGSTVQKLRKSFATHGLPAVVVSDNGTPFTGEEFEIFLKQNGIKHSFSPPYHPASNGLAERAVQTVKRGIKSFSTGTLEERLDRFLFQYRITPQTTTGVPPAELLMKRKLNSKLDLLRPDLASKVEGKQEDQTRSRASCRHRQFDVSSAVYARDYRPGGKKWTPGTIVERNGLVYVVNIPGIKPLKWRRHIEQLRERHPEAPKLPLPPRVPQSSIEPVVSAPFVEQASSSQEDIVPPPSDATCSFDLPELQPAEEHVHEPVSDTESGLVKTSLRRTARISKPPERLIYE